MLILIPAYGKSYTSKEDLLADWNAGKDFKIYGGPYTSIRDSKDLRADFGDIKIHFNPVSNNFVIV